MSKGGREAASRLTSRAMNCEGAIARAVRAVAGVPPHVDSMVARAAIERVTSRTRSRNMITEHLLARPTGLVDGDSDAPAPVAPEEALV